MLIIECRYRPVIKTKMTHIRLLFLLTLLGSALTGKIISQSIGKNSTTSPERGTSTAGRSFSLSDIESINNYSGDLMFNIRVGSLAPGRGDMSAGLTLGYSSKIWDVKT